MLKKIKILLLTLVVALLNLIVISACEGEPHVHEYFTNEKVVVAATCLTDGTGSHICVDCEETVEFVIPKLGHTEVIDQGKAPTCTADGISEGKHCSVCSAVLVAQEVLPARHTPSDWQVLKKASCEIDGLKVKVCIDCEERLESETINHFGHTEGDWQVIKQPTCLNQGTKTTSCITCNETMQTVTIAATGHNEGDWQVIKQPTCLNQGTKTTSCITCNELMQTASIPATGHDESDWIITLNATCENSGSKHTICNTCKEELNKEKINPLGHDKTDWKVTLEPTCTATGLKHIECTRCDSIFDETVIDAKGHTYSTSTVQPTCTTDGYTLNDCIRCDYSYRSNTTQKTGHEYTSSITQPSCLEGGYTEYSCVKCEDTYNGDFIDPLEHNHVEKTQNPTCLTAGKKYKECTRCNDYLLIETLKATGHTLTTNNYVKDMGGSNKRTATIYECANCDYSYVKQIVFNYSITPNYKVGTQKGYSYGMSIDYSDLTNQTVSTFKVEASFTYAGSNAHPHFYITPSGSINKELSFIGGADDKVDAIANAEGYIEADNENKTWGGYVDYPYSKVKDNNVYFVFINQNYLFSYTVKTLSATSTFDFGEPTL